MGLFITFEGPEGSGKTTQIQLLGEWLSCQGYNVLITREPGGTPLGDQIRAILLSPEHRDMCPEAEALLFSVARSQLVRQVIQPHLNKGGVVLCDRYADSTLAYQGYGRGLDLDMLGTIITFATGGLWPDLTIYLDLPVEEGLARRRQSTTLEWNRLDAEQLAFHQRVREGYLRMAAASPRWLVLDARQPIELLQQAIREQVAKRCKLPISAFNSKVER
ncbi:MAG: dTMP kinase [Anaerolineae bacterium]|nr:dTMP kinase [Anaerolineae bacterium]MDW8098133.1 dTMP kinase [Anaerolineae bacterium]